jgi:hypothetical protein
MNVTAEWLKGVSTIILMDIKYILRQETINSTEKRSSMGSIFVISSSG